MSRDRIVFLSRPKVVDMVIDTVTTSECPQQKSSVTDLSHHDNVLDPEMGEMLDFTQDVKS